MREKNHDAVHRHHAVGPELTGAQIEEAMEKKTSIALELEKTGRQRRTHHHHHDDDDDECDDPDCSCHHHHHDDDDDEDDEHEHHCYHHHDHDDEDEHH